MPEVEGQLNSLEREVLTKTILERAAKPQVILEVGTWLGGGSTVQFLRALEQNGQGHLWGIECDRSIYDQMIANIKQLAPEALHRFTPLFGFSQQVIPTWIKEQKPGFEIDVAFLDGGNQPIEQLEEFWLIDPHMPVGSTLLGHDAKLRKGKWFVPYVSRLDNWKSQVHDISHEGLFRAEKIAAAPSPASLADANAFLKNARMQPMEVLSRTLPPSVRRFASKILPRRFVRRVAEGH